MSLNYNLQHINQINQINHFLDLNLDNTSDATASTDSLNSLDSLDLVESSSPDSDISISDLREGFSNSRCSILKINKSKQSFTNKQNEFFKYSMKNINEKKNDINIQALIYNPPYHLLCQIDQIDQIDQIEKELDNYINNFFNISKNYLKSNVHPDTIKAILVPYSSFRDAGLCCASSYYQLYNRSRPIKKIILLCTNTSNTITNFISTSFTTIKSYKNTSTSLKFDTITIDKLKPYLEINNENIKNEISLISQLPFIQTIAPNASLIPILSC